MRIRQIALAVTVVALIGLVPVGSQARPYGPVTSLYKLTGTLSVVDKTNTWSLSGSLSLVRTTGKTPKTAMLSASGKIGAASVPTDPCMLTATTGRLKISWSSEQPSTATVVHVMTHPVHTFTGMIGAGYRRNAVVIIWLQHKPNNGVSGQVGIIVPAE
jgi:hypothetical protein